MQRKILWNNPMLREKLLNGLVICNHKTNTNHMPRYANRPFLEDLSKRFDIRGAFNMFPDIFRTGI